MEDCQLGFVKIRFPIKDLSPPKVRNIDRMIANYKNVHRTNYSIFVQLGHQDLTDNETARDLIRDLKREGARVTRVDFTVDLCIPFDFQGYKTAMDQAYETQTMDKKIGLPSLWTSLQGDTVYVGKRSSARFFRVYDKRKEVLAKQKVDIGFELTRFEIECKKSAVGFYLPLFMSGNTQAIVQDIAWRYNLPVLCEEPARHIPDDVEDTTSSPWAFVFRYRRIIRQAYYTDTQAFLDILGEK